MITINWGESPCGRGHVFLWSGNSAIEIDPPDTLSCQCGKTTWAELKKDYSDYGEPMSTWWKKDYDRYGNQAIGEMLPSTTFTTYD